MPTSVRQAKAAARFQRLAEQGAPPDAVCSLCHLEEDEVVVYDHPEDGSEVRLPLGRLLLVRTSTITHAWVHQECGRWCPEVRLPLAISSRSNICLDRVIPSFGSFCAVWLHPLRTQSPPPPLDSHERLKRSHSTPPPCFSSGVQPHRQPAFLRSPGERGGGQQ